MKKYMVVGKKYNKTDTFAREERKELLFNTIGETHKFAEDWESKSDNCFYYEARIRTVVICCGELLVCEKFTNTCDNCESDYNFSGDILAPREQWGCETGENWTDCY